MKIGIFDSGLGGLFIMRSIVKLLPQYDYVYCGDTKRVPYGNRSHETIYTFTTQALSFLFRQKCSLVILACNSASAQSLRHIQRTWIPKHFPNKKVLGVIIPAVEAALEKTTRRIGILGTHSTVSSHAFRTEIQKRSPNVRVTEQAAPLLVPFVESGEKIGLQNIIRRYAAPLKKMDTIILGCTHYGILHHRIKNECPKKVRIISENKVIPKKLKSYLLRHPEIAQSLTRKRTRRFFATEITPTLARKARIWFGASVQLRKAAFAE